MSVNGAAHGVLERRWLYGGFALALALFAVGAWGVHRQNLATVSANAQVEQALRVLRQALQLDAEVLQMENDQRAFLIRGDARFIADRDAHHVAALALLASLRERTAGNAAQLRRLDAAGTLLAARYETMRGTVAVARSAGLDAARVRFRSDGAGSLDPMRAELAALRSAESQELGRRAQAAGDYAEGLRWAIFAMPAAGLLVLAIAFRALLLALAGSERLRGELAAAGAIQRSMLDSAGYMIVAVDPDGTIRLFNRSASERLGWRPEEVVGRETPALFHDADEVDARAEVLSTELGRPVEGIDVFTARVRDGGVDEREWTYVARDGSRFPVQLAVSALRDDDGELLGFIGMAQDITRRQADDREIRALAAALEASVKELESFSYSVSHDLRAPLRHIDGYARMLAEDLGTDLAAEPRRLLDAISASSRRMGALIDDLLSLSRLGRKPLETRPVDMTALATEAWSEVMQDSQAPVQFDIEPLPPCDGDPALLRQVWLNLLSNAVKYSAPRGSAARVEVSGGRADGVATYSIRDNGVGFDPRYADKLFGVFQRLHPQDRFEGTGVGLAIVHRIVGRHGGTVSARSQPDAGACFVFELPARREA